MKFLQGLLIVALAFMIGCASTTPPPSRTSSDQGQPAQQTEQAPPPAKERSQVKTQQRGSAYKGVQDLIQVTPSAPGEAVLGQTYTTDVKVVGVDFAGNVEVATRLPAGVEYVKSEPSATPQQGLLRWQYESIDKGETKNIRLWLRPTREGTAGLCFTASAFPKYCVVTKVGKPLLTIQKTGPKTASLGADVTYRILVENKGSAVARDVVVTDNVPAQLQDAQNRRTLQYNVGDMAPGAKKNIDVTLKAVQRGQACNVAVAKSSNAGEVKDQACTEILKEDLNLAVNCPKQKYVNENGETVIGVRNPGDTVLRDVVLTAVYPEQLQLLQAEGSPQTQNRQAVWRFAELAPGAEVKLRMNFKGTFEGTHCVRVTVVSGDLKETSECCTKWIGVAKLAIQKDAPATAKLGAEFTYQIAVRNVGTGVAQNVVLTDTLPQGIEPLQGSRQIRQPLGNMMPNDTKKVSIPVRATRPGEFVNEAIADADNTDPVKDPATTRVLVQEAEVAIVCPEESFIGKRSESVVSVANTGDVALNRVVVTATWSNKLVVSSASGSTSLGDTKAVWELGQLAPGKKVRFPMEIISKFAGRHCIDVQINTAEGVTDKASCCTLWRGFPALLIELIDTNDPLLAGEQTTYIIEITNQGTAADENIRIVAKFPSQITPISASGDTAHQIQGKTVTYQAYPKLAPKQKITFKIQAKAVQEGDSRLKVELTSRLLTNPVTEEESTQVY